VLGREDTFMPYTLACKKLLDILDIPWDEMVIDRLH
jgi:hypothetical protein